ncbi:MAG: BamA/TamA family outer membrane protein, partial [Flavisolibacter sp.]
TGKVREHISNGIDINHYDFERRKFDKKGWSLMPNYTNTRGVFFQFGYKASKYKWRKEPFARQQSLKANYSVTNKSFGGDYVGIFNEAIGKWNLILNGSYDQSLKYYFFGLGNESFHNPEQSVEYYQLHTTEGRGSIGLNRLFDRHNSFTIAAFYENIKAKKELDHLSSETLPVFDETAFNTKNFLSGVVGYTYYNVNDEVVPSRAFSFSLNASHTKNLSQTDRSFSKYWASVGWIIPFSNKFSFATRNGYSTLDGKPEFYQYNWIGGGATLRGFRRQRFAGRSSVYTDNELRWITNMNGYLFKGKIGLMGFIDQGRVWMPEETSHTWHVGYGGGLMISPFNKIAASFYYGISEDDHLIHIRLGRFF